MHIIIFLILDSSSLSLSSHFFSLFLLFVLVFYFISTFFPSYFYSWALFFFICFAYFSPFCLVRLIFFFFFFLSSTLFFSWPPTVDSNTWTQVISLYPTLVECITCSSPEVSSALKEAMGPFKEFMQPPASRVQNGESWLAYRHHHSIPFSSSVFLLFFVFLWRRIVECVFWMPAL